MKKTELISAVAEKAEISQKDVAKVLEAFTDVVTEEMKHGGRVQMVGFGAFEAVHRDAREGRNPNTGDPMTIEATWVPKFKAARALRQSLNA